MKWRSSTGASDLLCNAPGTVCMCSMSRTNTCSTLFVTSIIVIVSFCGPLRSENQIESHPCHPKKPADGSFAHSFISDRSATADINTVFFLPSCEPSTAMMPPCDSFKACTMCSTVTSKYVSFVIFLLSRSTNSFTNSSTHATIRSWRLDIVRYGKGRHKLVVTNKFRM